MEGSKNIRIKTYPMGKQLSRFASAGPLLTVNDVQGRSHPIYPVSYTHLTLPTSDLV